MIFFSISNNVVVLTLKLARNINLYASGMLKLKVARSILLI